MKIIGAFAIITILVISASIGIRGTGAQSSCTEALSGNGTTSGTWTSDCISQNTPTEPTTPPSGTRYARFYTFTLIASTDVTIDITSSTDTYMYLMEGAGASGNVLYENDDVVSGNTDSQVSESLPAGDYTVEATTYSLETTGSFTLTVQGLPIATPTVQPTDATPSPTPDPRNPTATPEPTPTPPPVPDPTVTPTPVRTETTTLTPASILVAGPNHACSLDSSGEVFCQGHDSHGQVSERPTSRGFTALTLGAHHTCALDENGRVHCWGSDVHGQSSPPTQSGFTGIKSGNNYNCGLDSVGVTTCWGRFEPVSVVTPEPTPDPTPELTPEPTAVPTPEPTPEPTSTPGNISTRLNPVPFGQAFRPPTSPWELKVTSVDRDAWPEIEAESDFNDPPDSGNKFVLIAVEVRNRGTTADSFSAHGLSMVGSRNVEYEGSVLNCNINSLPNEFDYSARIFPNGTATGTICHEVMASETNSLVLFGDYFDFDVSYLDYRDTLWFWELR